MIEVIAEHSVKTSLLPEKANILDAGCRGFEFSRYFLSLGHNVWSIDADNLIHDDYSQAYTQVALMGKSGLAGLVRVIDRQATQVTWEPTFDCVRAESIESLTRNVNLEKWDLIKLDIEGSEYEVIMSMDKPYATQITVEMHTHCGQTEEQVTEMVNKLHSLGYKTIQHEKTARHGLQPNYWDTLFIL